MYMSYVIHKNNFLPVAMLRICNVFLLYSYCICPYLQCSPSVFVRSRCDGHCQVVVFGSGWAGGESLPERAHVHNLNRIQLTMMMMVTMVMAIMMVMMVIMMFIMV